MGDTPLHVAASHGHLNIVNLLLESGCDPTIKNYANSMAEDLACDSAVKNVIQMSRSKFSDTVFDNEEEYYDESD